MANKKNNKKSKKSNIVDLNSKNQPTQDSVQKTTAKQQIKLPDFLSVESTVGAVAMLAAKSQSHKHLFASDYDWLVIPPVTLRQCRLFRGPKNGPIAFVSWASVSEEVEKRLLSGVTKLQPKDWKSGDRLYIIDIINPFNVGKEILKQLQEKQFSGKEVKILRAKKEGNGVEGRLLKDVLDEIAVDTNTASN